MDGDRPKAESAPQVRRAYTELPNLEIDVLGKPLLDDFGTHRTCVFEGLGLVPAGSLKEVVRRMPFRK